MGSSGVSVCVCAHVRSGSGNAALRRAIVTYKQHFVPSFITLIVIGLESPLNTAFIYILAIPRSFLKHAACNHVYFSGTLQHARWNSVCFRHCTWCWVEQCLLLRHCKLCRMEWCLLLRHCTLCWMEWCLFSVVKLSC